MECLSPPMTETPTGTFLVQLQSPDEWATTKQACRDTYVVTCFLPSTIRILALLYVLSTVLRISSSNLFLVQLGIFKCFLEGRFPLISVLSVLFC